MATNPYVNKVVYDGTTIIDISDTTATASDVLNSKYIYTASGQKVQGSIASKSSSDLTVNGATVTAPAGFYSSSASKTVASGTEGTPTATKGTVSNHSISVTPSVTNSAGYISGGTHTGTAVTVTASELASGNKEITQNGSNIDVVGYSTVSVNVSGGGGSSVAVETIQNSSSTTSTLTFTGLKGEPTSFSVFVDNQVSTSSPASIAAIVYDGTSVHTQTISTTSNAQVSYVSSGVTYTYNNGTLTITSATAQFVNAEHYLTYSYNGSASNIGTADVQVGSGATSITFTGLEDEPIAWSCIFKSNFSTSSGYQRVVATRFDGDILEGFAMDSFAHPSSSYWSQSYNNGSFTITSQGTNAGGYFHQPGYYQLTYVIGEASPYQKVNKTYYASTTAQTDKVEPSTGYDAMSEVNISIPAVSQTNLVAGNIKSGTTVTISNGSTNLWSVTGTYSGGGSGGGLTLLKTISLGEMATTSTTAVDAHKSVTLENSAYNAYDVLILDISVDTQVNGHHTSTVSMIYVTGQSDVSNKGTFAVGSNKWNSKLSSLGVASTRNATSGHGIYANSVSVSNGTMTIPLYYRSSSQTTGTLDGTYTARVYGLNLYDMIGG